LRTSNLTKIPESFTNSEQAERITELFDFELLTPMFGGDTKSWQIDTKNPVRTSAIKGQLRFWWRTMQNENNHSTLLEKENAIWGGETFKKKRIKSPTSIAVLEQTDIETKVAEMENKFAVKGNIIPKCVLFPITSIVKDENEVDIHFITELKFKLQISYPAKYKEEIINSLKLWTLFGGVGARTRRGTGSIYCESLLNNFSSIDDIKNWLTSIKSGNQKLNYPVLAGSQLASKEQSNGNAAGAWRLLLDSYGKFRQQRTPSKPRPGRSFWPEPDAIRRITGRHSSMHKPEHSDGIWFPRAAFGLPIIFELRSKGDPGTFHLEPNIRTGERLPSPMILKAIKLPNNKIYTTMFVLGQNLPANMILKGNNTNHQLDPNEIPSYTTNKIMVKGKELNGRSIYQAAADALNLGELS